MVHILPAGILYDLWIAVYFRLRNGEEVELRTEDTCFEDGSFIERLVCETVAGIDIHSVERSTVGFLGDEPSSGIEVPQLLEAEL